VTVKRRVSYAVLAAVGLCFILEALCRYFPSLLPQDLNVFRVKHSLIGRVVVKDDALDYVPAAGFHQVSWWRGRRLEIRNAAFPGESRAGYRADSRTVGPHADIAALGDSFTNAAEVDGDSTWPSRLGAMAGLQVANLGVPGYGTAQELEFFRRYGSRLRPKLVVLLMGLHDPSRNMFFQSWRLREDPGARGSQTLFCRSSGTSGIACKAVKFVTYSGILPNLAVNWLFLRWKAAPFIDPEGAEAGRRIMRQALEGLQSQASSQGARFCVVLYDDWESLFPKSYTELTGFLREKGIPYLDLGLRKKYPKVKLEVALDGHWNEAGNALAATEIHRFLRGKGLLPSRR